MTLVEDLIGLGDRRYRIDWSAVKTLVLQRLAPAPWFSSVALEPSRSPTYWCVPILIGDYVGATRAAVLADLEPFVSGCLLRHFMFDERPPFDLTREDEISQATRLAYHGCRLDANPGAGFEARFAAKCWPWTMLMAIGTRSILDETTSQSDFDAAMRASVLVFSCLQVIDDWHDRVEDVARAHWNMWVDEPASRTLAVIEPLLGGAQRALAELRPHLLRRALAAQLEDTVRELAEVVELHGQAQPRPPDSLRHPPPLEAARPGDRVDVAIGEGVDFLRRRLEAERVPLWRDFELAGVSAGSTECISAFVANELATVPEAALVARPVVAQLLSQPRMSGGWGYRADVPEDCDSTAWVLLAAASTGSTVSPGLLASSLQFILTHQRRNGGFATYRREARRSLNRANERGWFEPDVAVTASAMLALHASGFADRRRLQEACRFLAASNDHGRWHSYWWQGSSYATFLAARALRTVDNSTHDALLNLTGKSIRERRRPDGGWCDSGDLPEAFATSLALMTLMLGSRTYGIHALAPSIRFLLDLQQPTGAWPGSAVMLAPGAAETGDLQLRDSDVVTTATVVAALNMARDRRLV
jgi:Squalene-hopene cyclase C-terminal domain